MKAPLTLTIDDADGNVLLTITTDEDVGPFLALIDEGCLDTELESEILRAADEECRRLTDNPTKEN